MRSSCADPTRTPTTSVIRLAVMRHPWSVAPRAGSPTARQAPTIGIVQAPSDCCGTVCVAQARAGSRAGRSAEETGSEHGRPGAAARRSERTVGRLPGPDERPVAGTGWKFLPVAAPAVVALAMAAFTFARHDAPPRAESLAARTRAACPCARGSTSGPGVWRAHIRPRRRSRQPIRSRPHGVRSYDRAAPPCPSR